MDQTMIVTLSLTEVAKTFEGIFTCLQENKQLF